jgi:hypothetical protein
VWPLRDAVMVEISADVFASGRNIISALVPGPVSTTRSSASTGGATGVDWLRADAR